MRPREELAPLKRGAAWFIIGQLGDSTEPTKTIKRRQRKQAVTAPELAPALFSATHSGYDRTVR